MTSSRARIQIPRDRVVEFCHRNHIRRLALFGSVLRDDFTSASDVDMLVEFEPGKTPGFAFFRMQDELSEIIGRRVDLNTPAIGSFTGTTQSTTIASGRSLPKSSLS